MAVKRSGLGRGIGALIPASEESKASRPVDVFFPQSKMGGDTLSVVTGVRLAHLTPDDIVPNAAQPRRIFDEDDLAELVQSIREVGVLQPIVVRPLRRTGAESRAGVANGATEENSREGSHYERGEVVADKYELVMGERRLRASKVLGLATIPAVVKDTADEDMLRDALLENLHRSQLNPLEEASAYQQLLSDFGITQEELASRIGRSRPQISNAMRLLRLPLAIQTRVAAGVLSAGHARAILSLRSDGGMQRLADKIINEDLSVRATEVAATRMNGSGGAASVKAVAGKKHAHLDEIAERLGDRLDTRVKVGLGSKKGQVVIEFSSIQDLNRILANLGEPGYGNTTSSPQTDSTMKMPA